mgnify:CR=1 FL=1
MRHLCQRSGDLLFSVDPILRVRSSMAFLAVLLMVGGAAVMLWLATNEAARDYQRQTIHCQSFAREHGIVADWR